ncbi:hypothetical protein OG389_32340 [Streptomyces sp. NBC_00435]|uniref:hypothetical protein n=1 Tax=Streptomyces sp. NBC_00435 TaxID=2903649 RepID=UPI002E24D0A4
MGGKREKRREPGKGSEAQEHRRAGDPARPQPGKPSRERGQKQGQDQGQKPGEEETSRRAEDDLLREEDLHDETF